MNDAHCKRVEVPQVDRSACRYRVAGVRIAELSRSKLRGLAREIGIDDRGGYVQLYGLVTAALDRMPADIEPPNGLVIRVIALQDGRLSQERSASGVRYKGRPIRELRPGDLCELAKALRIAADDVSPYGRITAALDRMPADIELPPNSPVLRGIVDRALQDGRLGRESIDSSTVRYRGKLIRELSAGELREFAETLGISTGARRKGEVKRDIVDHWNRRAGPMTKVVGDG